MSILKDLLSEAQKKSSTKPKPSSTGIEGDDDKPFMRKPKAPSFVAGSVFINMTKSGELAGNMKTESEDKKKVAFTVLFIDDKGEKKSGTYRAFTADELKKEFKKKGFKVEKITKKEDLVEAKKQPEPFKPRAQFLNQLLATKKGGGHYSEKSDYKRAKEKQKTKKELDRSE